MIKKLELALIACVVLSASPAGAQDDTLRVLFVGNSHTYMNNVPLLFANLSQSGGHPVATDMSAPGGYTLLQHTTNDTTLTKISLGIWDYVVLQEQSLYPVIDFYRFGSYYPAARTLDSLITDLGQRTAIYMTWGRPAGGQWSIGGHYSIDFVDFFQMQDSVSAACEMIADELAAVLLPAGDAWATARTWDSTVNLWQVDNIHATLKGSYLAACVFYAVLFNASPVGLPYSAGLSPDDALFLQRAAEQTVLDVGDDSSPAPELFGLLQNYPNPFNSQTVIRFHLAEEAPVVVDIFDLLGRKVATPLDAYMPAGNHSVIWNPADRPSGIYFYKIEAENRSETRKMTFLK
jgi:hypothetical protein